MLPDPDAELVLVIESKPEAKMKNKSDIFDVVQTQAGDEKVLLRHALCPQRTDDIEAVASVGDVHRIE